MNPSVDYLFGYPVKSINAKKDGSGFAIEFGGHGDGSGSIIGIEKGENDENIDVPHTLDGKQLITVIRSTNSLRLIFGNVDARTNEILDREEVEVGNANYLIVDPRFNGEPHYPGRANMADADRSELLSLPESAGDFLDGPMELPDAESDEDEPDATQPDPEA
jgi:hypothetical protein